MKPHLIDGTYELFRAYYGAPGARSPAGIEVGASRGILRSMLSLLRDPTCTHVGVAFDHELRSYRNDLFDGYKTGEGIEPEIAGKIFQQGFSTKQIFDPMQPNSSDSPGEKHIGMGLYITRNHVISMGGSIQFKSDRQTTFEVSIPKYQA